MRFFVVVVSAAVFASGCFELNRSDGIGEAGGRARFVVRDSAGAPVVGARVFADGTGRTAVSDEDGNVSVEGLVAGDYVLRVGADDDDDGDVDRAAIVPVTLAVVPFSKGPFLQPADKLTTALPGDVTLTATGTLSVTVEGCGVDDLCRVVVFRDVTFADDHVVAGAIEQSGVVVGGTFLLSNVAAGAVHVAAFAWPRPLSTAPVQQAIAASTTISQFAVADVDVEGGGTQPLTLTLGPVPADVETTVEVRREAAVVERLTGTVTLTAPSSSVDAGDPVDFSAASFGVVVPVAVVTVTTAVTSSNPDAEPPTGGEFGTITVVGVPGMPAISSEVANVAERACRTLVDGNDDVPDCDLDGDVDDADDDADGQDDADEPGCVGIGLGADFDHDCLCDVVDPFPLCTSNDPIACDLVDPPDCAQ